jgi:hypothetical protein
MLHRPSWRRSWSDRSALHREPQSCSRTVRATIITVVLGASIGLFAEPACARASAEGEPRLTGAGRAEFGSGTVDAPPRGPRSVGLMFDLGTLDGGMLSLVYRPLSWLRLHGGAGTNGAGPGIRAGAVVPFSRGWGVSLEGGHFFPGNLNGVFSAFAGPEYDDSHLLESVSYDFANVQLGWEIERSDLVFFVRAGVGYVWSQLPAEGLASVENLSSLVDPDGSVEVLLPSLKLGFIGFL